MNKLAQSGIYKITNAYNGKIYVGGSVNIYVRFYAHRRDLSKNIHVNKYLQRAYNKYWGSYNFKYEVLEFCPKEKLIEREQYWLDQTRCYDDSIGYNLFKFAKSALGYKQSDEHKKRIGESNRGRKVSDEAKRKISEKNKGYKHTEEALRLISKASKGNKHTLGRKLTPEHKKLLSIALKGRVNLSMRNVIAWPCADGTKCKCDKCKEHRAFTKNRTKRNRKDFKKQLLGNIIASELILPLMSLGG